MIKLQGLRASAKQDGRQTGKQAAEQLELWEKEKRLDDGWDDGDEDETKRDRTGSRDSGGLVETCWFAGPHWFRSSQRSGFRLQAKKKMNSDRLEDADARKNHGSAAARKATKASTFFEANWVITGVMRSSWGRKKEARGKGDSTQPARQHKFTLVQLV
jgi:hypothetical protein